MIKDLTYKQFIKTSKWLVNYKDHTRLGKIIFYIQSPFRYMLFKKVIKNELKKEGK